MLSYRVVFSSSASKHGGGEQEMGDCFNLNQEKGTRRSCSKAAGESETGRSASFLLPESCIAP